MLSDARIGSPDGSASDLAFREQHAGTDLGRPQGVSLDKLYRASGDGGARHISNLSAPDIKVPSQVAQPSSDIAGGSKAEVQRTVNQSKQASDAPSLSALKAHEPSGTSVSASGSANEVVPPIKSASTAGDKDAEPGSGIGAHLLSPTAQQLEVRAADVSVGSGEDSATTSPTKLKKEKSVTSAASKKKKKGDKDKKEKKKEESDDGSEHERPFKDLFIEDLPPMQRNRLIFGNYEQDKRVAKSLRREATAVKDMTKAASFMQTSFVGPFDRR